MLSFLLRLITGDMRQFGTSRIQTMSNKAVAEIMQRIYLPKLICVSLVELTLFLSKITMVTVSAAILDRDITNWSLMERY